MIHRINLLKQADAIAMMTGILIVGVGMLIVFGIMSFFVIQAIIANFIPISIGICLIIVLPIVAKGVFPDKEISKKRVDE